MCFFLGTPTSNKKYYIYNFMIRYTALKYVRLQEFNGIGLYLLLMIVQKDPINKDSISKERLKRFWPNNARIQKYLECDRRI